MIVNIFDIFGLVGTIAFAISGAIVAMEEEYDILGVFVLGMVTAFGGGIVRNLLIDIDMSVFWNQGFYLRAAMLAILIVFLLPVPYIAQWKRALVLFDAIGLAAFAVQGALYAMDKSFPLSAVAVAAMLTGIGGGLIRDLLAGRKPLVLRDEIYAVWALAAGFAIGWFRLRGTWELLTVFTLVVIFRLLSVHYKWKLPRRSLRTDHAGSPGSTSDG
jgi:uncharacterized membrane protein YeiH